MSVFKFRRRRILRVFWGVVVAMAGPVGVAAANSTLPIEPDALPLRAIAKWMLVVDGASTPCERYAAEEFQSLFRLATGTTLSMGVSAASGGAIYIGEGKLMRAHPLGFATDELGDEGLRIRMSRDALIIAGGRPRGALYGVYEFFERYVGVRFLTSDHTYIPSQAGDAVVPFVDYSYIPPFSFRWSEYAENSSNAAFAARLRNNTVTPDEKLGGNTPQRLIGHSVSNLLPVAKYGQDHPEYFALVHGKRTLDGKGGGPQLCVSNPAAVEIVAAAVDRLLEADPKLRNVSVSQMDNSDYCHCDDCEAINRREGCPMGAHLAFVNAVAERIEKKHPGVMVGTLAYAYTRKPPKTLVARDNVQIQLCSIECCTLHPVNDPTCAANRRFCADVAAWKEKCRNIWIWNYNTNFRAYDLPFPNLRAIAPNVRYFRDNNVRGVFMEANNQGVSGEMSDLRNYLISRVLWNPSLDGSALVDEFCRLHYGKAAAPILDYERFLHDNAEARGVHPACFPAEAEVGLSPRVARYAYDRFEEALTLAESDAVRARVEKSSICALRALLSTVTKLTYADGVCKLDLSSVAPGLVDRYAGLCKKYNVTIAANDRTSEDYIAELRRLENGLQAVKLENNVWRVIVLPEENGKIVEMTYKPTNRDLVTASARSFRRWRAHEDWSLQGPDPQIPFAFMSEVAGPTLTLTKTLKDGSLLRRTISLPDDGQSIDFYTTVQAGADAPKAFEFEAHSEYDTVLGVEGPDVIRAYVKAPQWLHANAGWKEGAENNPQKTVLESTQGGAFAYYNRDERFGVVQTYDSKSFGRQSLFWSPGRRQISLTLITSPVTLRKGEALSYGYSIHYLSEPPK